MMASCVHKCCCHHCCGWSARGAGLGKIFLRVWAYIRFFSKLKFLVNFHVACALWIDVYKRVYKTMARFCLVPCSLRRPMAESVVSTCPAALPLFFVKSTPVFLLETASLVDVPFWRNGHVLCPHPPQTLVWGKTIPAFPGDCLHEWTWTQSTEMGPSFGHLLKQK